MEAINIAWTGLAALQAIIVATTELASCNPFVSVKINAMIMTIANNK